MVITTITTVITTMVTATITITITCIVTVGGSGTSTIGTVGAICTSTE